METKIFNFKARWLLVPLVLMTLGVGNVWGADSGLTAGYGQFILDFYDSSKLTSTGGTGLTNDNYSSFVKVYSGLTKTNVVTGVSVTGTVRYGMNGGLTAGTGTAASANTHYVSFSIGSNFPVRKATVYATAYESGRWKLNSNTASSGSLGSKGATFASVTSPLIWNFTTYATSLEFKKDNGSGGNQKRLTIYTIVCEYGYRAYLTAPGTGSISAAPKTTNENGAGWNSTEGAVVGLKSTQKVTLTATPPDGYAVDAWTILKKSDNSDVTASVLDGNELTMPAYDVKVSVTWKDAAPAYTITAVSNNNSYGTVSLTGNVITASPVSGYRVSTTTAYNVTSGSATVVDNGDNTFTVTPSSNCTVRINFEAIPKYTVTLEDDGTELEQASAGAAVTLPSRTGCSGYTFAGWTKSWTEPQESWTTTAPTIIPAGSYTPTADENLYPVYRKTEGGSATYTLVSDAASFTDGTYVVAGLASSTYYFMDGTFTSDGLGVETTGLASSNVTDGSFAASSLPSGAIEIDVEDDGDPDGDDHYYFIWYESSSVEYFLNDYGTKQSILWDSESDAVYTYHPNFTQNAGTDGCVLLSGSGAKVSQNGSTKTSFIRNYASSGNFYNDMYFFKKSGGSTTYYISVPDCCDKNVTLATNSPANGSITFSPSGPIATCGAEASSRQTTMTITPNAGYYLSAWSTSGVTPASVQPAISTGSGETQTAVVTFSQNTTSGAYTANATFTAKDVTGWTWKQATTAEEITIPSPVNLYVGQQAWFNLKSYTPDVIDAKKGYDASYSNTYIVQRAKAADYYKTEAKAATESTTLTFTSTSNSSVTQVITIRITALPYATFTDIIHGETFGNVTATVDATDKRIVTTTLKTPTHSDLSDPGSGNECERNHLHLAGWILKDWADEHPDATSSQISGAGAGNFYAPDADIDLVAKNGKTFYAVWAVEE